MEMAWQAGNTHQLGSLRQSLLGYLLGYTLMTKFYIYISADPLRLQGERVREGTSAQGVEGSSMVLLCGGERSGPGDGAPAASKCVFTGSESDVRHLGLPFKPLKPLKSLKSLETCQKGLARGCFKMCFFTGSESDVRHLGHLGLLFKPLKPLKSLKSFEIPQSLNSLETCQNPSCSRLLQNVLFFNGIRKRR